MTILDKAAKCFSEVRENLIQGAALLYEIKEKNLYEKEYSSFGAYIEEACQISQSFAAKLIKVYGHYILEGGLTTDQIQRIDSEKLYLAISLPGTPQTQAVRAETWTRSEIKSELASKDGVECQHPSTVEICTMCHKRIS